MKKRVLKKSEVLREGYVKGLREGLNVINQMINEATSNASKKQRRANAEFVTKYLDKWGNGIVDAIKEKQEEINSKIERQFRDTLNDHSTSGLEYAICVSCRSSEPYVTQYAFVRDASHSYLKQTPMGYSTNTGDERIGVSVNWGDVYIYIKADAIVYNKFKFDVDDYAKAIRVGLKNEAIRGCTIGNDTKDKFAANEESKKKNRYASNKEFRSRIASYNNKSLEKRKEFRKNEWERRRNQAEKEYDDEVSNVNARNQQKLDAHNSQGFFKRTFGSKPKMEQATNREEFIRNKMRQSRN